MFRKLFGFLVFAAVMVLLWFGFALWTGMYSVYSLPPTKQAPDGSTLIVSRDEGEPLFDSPDRPPVVKKEQANRGIGFGSSRAKKRPIPERTILTLPFIDWAYKKSLEPPEAESIP